MTKQPPLSRTKQQRKKAPRPGLLPLVPVYAAVRGVKAWLLERGWLRQRRLGRPVISVGSVSAGGAGKTPVVLLLAELLGRAGFAVRILSRGYGRSSTAIERVDAGGDAARYGDEPMLLARRLATPAEVWVGADRYAAGMLAEASESDAKAVYLLDDGFQHRKLARDLDVVLLTQRDVEDCLLPGGNLREPLRALRRANVVVLREEDAGLTEFVERLCGRMPAIWMIRRRLVAAPLPARPVVFSGIARPESFLAMLAELGCEAVAEVRFRDHHRYTSEDIERLLRVGREDGADGFVTTEKDAVKLSRGMLERLGRVVVPELRVELVEAAAALELLLQTVGSGSQVKTNTGVPPLRSER
jgi:tetraacyldisaccharide 4'-kinase